MTVFERVSDASYAWKDRPTYIRELEELDINFYDLLFCIIFQTENPEKTIISEISEDWGAPFLNLKTVTYF